MSRAGIAMIVSGFPRRSETFALGELVALDRQGVLAAIFATKPGDGLAPQPDAGRLSRPVQLLAPGSPADQAAAVVARLGRAPIAGVHGYFAHRPAEVAAEVARRLARPFGFSAHAKDVRKVTPEALSSRARAARCVVACNADVAADLRTAGASVHLMPHGVDLRRFRPAPSVASGRLRLLAVGRLVPKKGFDVLVAAAARLRLPFELHIVGDGPDRARLAALIADAGLADRVSLRGSRTHAELPADYAAADIVVVPSVVDDSGDRDGLPNVVLEAMASGRPIVASDVGAIASAVAHLETGCLLPPGDDRALAAAIDLLAGDRRLRERLGRRGRARVERDFDRDCCAARLGDLLRQAYD
jgi:glycosyltransferase involved in cell wall biosynthesis